MTQGAAAAVGQLAQAERRCSTREVVGRTMRGADVVRVRWVAFLTLAGAERTALSECTLNNPTGGTIVGSRGTCGYDMGPFADCNVGCPISPNHFRIQCGGPTGLPLRCSCAVNSYDVGDLDWEVGTFYASDCRDAATRIANGEWCTNRLDCCLKYVEHGEEKCRCGSERGCDDLARYYGATYVDTCPQYEP